MKKGLIILATLLAQNVFAASVDVTATYEVIDASASCKANCIVNEETNESRCRYQIYFEKASYDQINALKQQNSYRDTWFEKSPKEICEAKLLPEDGQGYGSIKVMLYKLDLTKLNSQF